MHAKKVGNCLCVLTQRRSFPMVIRSFGMSWSIMGQFIATVILLEAAPTAFATIGYRFWVILICLTFIYAVLVYFFLPETKGMTLEVSDYRREACGCFSAETMVLHNVRANALPKRWGGDAWILQANPQLLERSPTDPVLSTLW